MAKILQQYQIILLRRCLENGKYSEYLRELDETYFEPEYRNVVGCIKNALEKNVIISYTTVLQGAKLAITNKADWKQFAHAFQFLKNSQRVILAKEEHTIEKLLYEEVRLKALATGVTDAFLSLQDGKLDETEKTLEKALYYRMESYKSVNYFEESIKYYSDTQKIADDQLRIVPSGIPLLDAILTRGGFRKSNLVLIAAQSGVGKSSFMIYLTSNFVRRNLKVLHVNLEMTLEETRERLDACFTNTPTQKLIQNRKTVLSKLRHRGQMYSDNLILLEMPPQSTNVFDIQRFIERQASTGWRPDVVVVDGADDLGTIRTVREAHIAAAQPYIDLKQIGREDGYLVLTDAQIHRSEEEKTKSGFFSLESLGGAYKRGQIADTVLTLNLEKDRITLFIAKQRGMARFKSMILQADYSTHRFEGKLK